MAKKEGIRKLFDRIAPDYDKLNHLLSLNIDKTWRRRAVKEIVRPSSADTILDVACGTGDFTIEIARKAAPASTIIGIDLSEGMMAIGRAKIAEAGLDKPVEVKMIQGDCEALPYPDETFDRISAGFGVRNFEHLEIGLGEMFRTLKKRRQTCNTRTLRPFQSSYEKSIQIIFSENSSGNRRLDFRRKGRIRVSSRVRPALPCP